MESDDFSAIDYYSTLIYAKSNEFLKEYALMLKYNQEAKKRTFANPTNNEYNVLFKEVIEVGDLELLNIITDLKLTEGLNPTEIIEIAIKNKHEKIALEILSDTDKYFTEPVIFLNKLTLIISSLEKNLLNLSKELLRRFIVNYNKPSHLLTEKEKNKLEILFQTLGQIGELDLIKIIKINSPLLFNEFYSFVIIEALIKGYIDIIAYYDGYFKFRKLNNIDKIDILDTALISNEVDFFEMVFDYLKPVELNCTEGENLLSKTKLKNKEIFTFLYKQK